MVTNGFKKHSLLMEITAAAKQEMAAGPAKLNAVTPAQGRALLLLRFVWFV